MCLARAPRSQCRSHCCKSSRSASQIPRSSPHPCVSGKNSNAFAQMLLVVNMVEGSGLMFHLWNHHLWNKHIVNWDFWVPGARHIPLPSSKSGLMNKHIVKHIVVPLSRLFRHMHKHTVKHTGTVPV